MTDRYALIVFRFDEFLYLIIIIIIIIVYDIQLIHTGNWTDSGWNPTKPMPNSAGCVHSHPEHVYRIYQALVRLGVKINDNTFSGKNYPYKPQGIGVIQLVE